MPKTGIEPISKSYKESVLPIKLYRQFLLLCPIVLKIKIRQTRIGLNYLFF